MRSNNKVCELATVCMPWQQWTETQYGFMLAYQHFTAVLLLIYGSLFLTVFQCAIARMSELELEQRTNTNFLLNLARVEVKSDRY
jgi:hypothetical protein